MGTKIFFPQRGESTAPAKEVCARCRVQAPCLEFALGIRERYGIWGGMSERPRLVLRRNQREAS